MWFFAKKNRCFVWTWWRSQLPADCAMLVAQEEIQRREVNSSRQIVAKKVHKENLPYFIYTFGFSLLSIAWKVVSVQHIWYYGWITTLSTRVLSSPSPNQTNFGCAYPLFLDPILLKKVFHLTEHLQFIKTFLFTLISGCG